MVAMRMRDEDVRDGLAPHGIEQRGEMRGIVGTRIDDRDLAASDDVAQRPLERERPGIVGHDPSHARHRLVDGVGREIKGLVEGNVVVGHGAVPIAPRTYTIPPRHAPSRGSPGGAAYRTIRTPSASWLKSS